MKKQIKRPMGRCPAWTLRASDHGAIQVEFALSILTILFVIFFMWELIMAVYTANVLSDAAKEGVRYAIVHGSQGSTSGVANPCSSPGPAAAVQNVVLNYAQLTFHDISAISVNVTYPDCDLDPPSRVRVEVTYSFIPYTALPVNPTLRTAAEGRIVY